MSKVFNQHHRPLPVVDELDKEVQLVLTPVLEKYLALGLTPREIEYVVQHSVTDWMLDEILLLNKKRTVHCADAAGCGDAHCDHRGPHQYDESCEGSGACLSCCVEVSKTVPEQKKGIEQKMYFCPDHAKCGAPCDHKKMHSLDDACGATSICCPKCVEVPHE
jgi:hypothetical protein